MKTISNSDFEELKEGLIATFSQEPKSFFSVFSTGVNLINKNIYEFNIRENKLEEARNLKVEDVQNLATRIFTEESRRLEIHYTSKDRIEEESTLEKSRNIAQIKDASRFRAMLPLYPDFQCHKL